MQMEYDRTQKLALPAIGITLICGCHILPTGGDIRLQVFSDAADPGEAVRGIVVPYFSVWNGGMFPTTDWEAFSPGILISGRDQSVHYPLRIGGGMFLDWPLNIGTVYYCEMLVAMDGYWPRVIRQHATGSEEARSGPVSQIYFRSGNERQDYLRARLALSDDIPTGFVGVARCFLVREDKPVPQGDFVRIARSWPGLKNAMRRLDSHTRASLKDKLLKFFDEGLRHPETTLIHGPLEAAANDLRGDTHAGARPK
jgi:hypothetical protein